MQHKAEAGGAQEWAQAYDQADSRPTTPRFAQVAERKRQNQKVKQATRWIILK